MMPTARPSHQDMILPDLPPEILFHIIEYLDINSRYAFGCINRKLSNMINEPSLWKETKVTLKTVDKKNKLFWKTLRSRQIRYLNVARCLKLTPKHYEVLLKYLKSSLVSLETQCTFLHMNRHVLKQLCVGGLEELSLHCGHSILPCEGCDTRGLKKLPKLTKLVLYNVTNTYLQHLSQELAQVCLPRLQVLHLGTGVVSALHAKADLASILHKQKTLKEICLPEYTIVTDSFFSTLSGSDGCSLSDFRLLGLCNILPVQEMLSAHSTSLCTLSLCVNAEQAATVMLVLSGLPHLTELGLKFAMVPVEPGFYHLGDLPSRLHTLSLAFEVSHTPMNPPCGQKLFHSGSRWFSTPLLASLPPGLHSSLHTLWVASIRLSSGDLQALDEFQRLETLTCRLMEDLPHSELLRVCGATRLRRLNLHSVRRKTDLAALRSHVTARSRGRVHVYTSTQTLLHLPAYLPQASSHRVHFTPL